MHRSPLLGRLALGIAALAALSDPALGSVQDASDRLRVMVQCTSACDDDYFRMELDIVDLVRTRQDAEVLVLLAEDDTQANGSRITLRFIGQGRFASRSHTLRQNVVAAETDDSIRSETLRLMRIGLVPYLIDADAVEAVTVVNRTRRSAPAQADPWDRWTFRTQFSGNGSAEQAVRSRTVGGSFNANRTTESVKLNLSVSGSSSRSRFSLPDSRSFLYLNERFTTSGLFAKSLGGHWSTGLRAVVSSATYENLDRSWFVTPVVEFNVFPYQELTRRLLTVQYGVGVRSFDYEEETVFGLLEQRTAAHVLNVAATARQPWGSLSAGVDVSSFLPEVKWNRVTASGDVEVNLARGLSLMISGEARSVRDQVYLRRGQATTEEVLVRQRQLSTRYQVYYSIGVAYTFGSIYSAVVNPRLDRGGF